MPFYDTKHEGRRREAEEYQPTQRSHRNKQIEDHDEKANGFLGEKDVIRAQLSAHRDNMPDYCTPSREMTRKQRKRRKQHNKETRVIKGQR